MTAITGLFKPPKQPAQPVASPPPLKPLTDLVGIQDAAGLTDKKIKAAQMGSEQFIWLPSVTAPKT